MKTLNKLTNNTTAILFAAVFGAATIAMTIGFTSTANAQAKKATYYSSTPNEKEIQIGANGYGRFTNQKVGKDTVSQIEARGSYALFFQDKLQIGGEAGFVNYSGGTSYNYFDLAAFGTWNFSTDYRNAFYAKGGLGLFGVRNDKGDYESKFGFFAGGGKRFPLWGSLNYNPEARIYKKGDQDASIEIMFLNASVMF